MTCVQRRQHLINQINRSTRAELAGLAMSPFGRGSRAAAETLKQIEPRVNKTKVTFMLTTGDLDQKHSQCCTAEDSLIEGFISTCIGTGTGYRLALFLI